jgi:adenylate kinase
MSTKNYILLGPPGSGKSTQAKRLKEAFDLEHIEMGSEMRAVSEEETPLGRAVNEAINHRHELTSDDIMEAVLEKALKRVPENVGVLIDGAPRRAAQIEVVSRALGDFGRAIDKVIFISISEEESVERISKRYFCFACRRPYVLGQDIFDIKKGCAVCGGKIGQRKDDTEEGVRKRYQVFSSETLPVIEYFEKEQILIRIDGQKSADEIFEDIKDYLKNNL